jgi:hypothetical protein
VESYQAVPGTFRHELLAGGEVVVPGPHQRRDLVAVGRQAGLLEQVAAVADALGAGVRAVADHLAVGVGRGGSFEVQPPAVELGIRQVDERVGLGEHRRHRVALDRLDVGEPGARGELGVEVLLGVVPGADLLLGDLDVGVGGVPLRDQVLVAELVERRDRDLDRAAGGAAVGVAVVVAARGQSEREDERRDGGQGQMTGWAWGAAVHQCLLGEV